MVRDLFLYTHLKCYEMMSKFYENDNDYDNYLREMLI